MANVTVNFLHDFQLHAGAYAPAVGTKEKPVFYQATKGCSFKTRYANDLMFKEEIYICGVFHIRSDANVSHYSVILR